MAGRKFKKNDRERIINEVGRLHRFGMHQPEIAERVGLSQSQISHYLGTIRQRYAEATIADRADLVAEKVEQLREVRMEAYTQWERSKLDAEKHVTEQVETPTENGMSQRLKEVETKEGQCGDPRYLEIIRQCLADEIQLRGLNVPLKIDVNTNINWNIFLPTNRPSNLAEQRMIEGIPVVDDGVPKLEDHSNGVNGTNGNGKHE